MSKKIPVFLLNGFLGSGKTTLLKKILSTYNNKKIAVIMNEFGKADVDGELLDEQGVQMTKITNGSIFCSCKSDKFVDALVEITKLKPEVIIVESSGLANPSTMPKIIELVLKLTKHSLEIKGVIGIVDASLLEKVIHTAVIVKSQIAHSDIIILNKIDLVTDEELKKVINLIRQYNKFAPIIKTQYCKVPLDILELQQFQASVDKENLPPNQNMLGTQNLLISMPDGINVDDLSKWLNQFANKTFRIKGFVKTNQGWFFTEGVNDKIYLNECSEHEKSYIVVLASGMVAFKELMLNSSEKILGKKIELM